MKPLFITAHYDDLEVSAGGTAARYGGSAVVLTPKGDKGTVAEATRAATILGIELLSPLDGRSGISEMTKIAVFFDTIITTSPWDTHPEHQAAASIARQVARKNNVGLWFMDHAVPGGRNFGPRPNHFVNIEKHRQVKDAALRCYNVLKQEVESIRSRDAYYGILHGWYAAEGFVVEHSIQ